MHLKKNKLGRFGFIFLSFLVRKYVVCPDVKTREWNHVVIIF